MHTIATNAGTVSLSSVVGAVRLNGRHISITEARELADALHFIARLADQKRQQVAESGRLMAKAGRVLDGEA